uniref:Uncharacterized protein n=1 Tax=Arundo donax TaxID=35708 RepID=A0A0A8ZYT1_ARUDO
MCSLPATGTAFATLSRSATAAALNWRA